LSRAGLRETTADHRLQLLRFDRNLLNYPAMIKLASTRLCLRVSETAA